MKKIYVRTSWELPEISTGNVPTSNFSFVPISNYMKQKRTIVSLTQRYEMREYGRIQVNLHVYLTPVLTITLPIGLDA
jgi:hypothetical protein